jgi:hypothetical protein
VPEPGPNFYQYKQDRGEGDQKLIPRHQNPLEQKKPEASSQNSSTHPKIRNHIRSTGLLSGFRLLASGFLLI